MTEQKDPMIQDMIQAAIKAGRTAQKIRSEGLIEVLKPDGTYQENADIEADNEIKKNLRKYGFGVFSEESKEGSESKFEWVVDPIDGTLNFKHKILPDWSVSIALKNKETGEIIKAVIYEPDAGKIYWAEKGEGAFVGEVGKNGKVKGETRLLIHNSKPSNIMELIGSYIRAKNPLLEPEFIKAFSESLGSRVHTRETGCSSVGLTHVAAGVKGAYVQLGVKEYDVAAAALIAKEAGARILMQPMKKVDEGFVMIAAHPKAYDKLVEVYERFSGKTPEANRQTQLRLAALEDPHGIENSCGILE